MVAENVPSTAMYKMKPAPTLSRSDLLFLYQHGGRTAEDVLWDKHERPYVLMWSSSGDQAVYVGKPNLDNIGPNTDIDYLLGFKGLSELNKGRKKDYVK